ncbi:helix-turn-helix transcriptional regulator [Dactylosporangium sp. NPDC051484]|uniref:helix-turn-helix domain-containing protein n=1 Tax=Dactylosporangium sp. NPDC051484 TaxID=3154942 RepID=UPI00344DBE48
MTALAGPSQHARQALGARLREIRKDANLSGRALAARCGWHFSKISKLEHGIQTPSEDDLRLWCQACGADSQTSDLIATVRAIDLMYVEWRRSLSTGMRHSQEARNALHERTTLFRIYESGIVPGLFQTAEYAATVIATAIELNRIPNDLDAAVAARLHRQQNLYAGDRRFLVVLEEQALRTRVGSADTMRGQLDRLLALASLPRVSLGIVPAMGERRIWPSAGFWIFDQGTVRVETPSAELTITQRSEIAAFEQRFERLQESAVYGQDARAVIAACNPIA